MGKECVADIFFYCSPCHATGGTELAHQGAAELRNLGFNARMLYGTYCDDPVADRFKKYNVPYVFKVEDCEQTLIVIPEYHLGYAREYMHARLIAWWMSVDNFLYDCSLKTAIATSRWEVILKYPKRLLLSRNNVSNKRVSFKFLSDRFDFHFYQSAYAKAFLKKYIAGHIKPLSDYINQDFLFTAESSLLSTERVKRILYNPSKGIAVTRKLMDILPNIEWKPLQGMSVNQLQNIFLSSMVYVDFGHHPGKDRLLREAAVNGCVIVTGKSGSAAHYEDVMINDSFKFKESATELKRASSLIVNIVNDFERYFQMQNPYREWIRGERGRFVKEISDCFAEYRNATVNNNCIL